MKKVVFRNFTKFTGKHKCQSLFFNKVAGLRHRCFPVNFVKFAIISFSSKLLDDCFYVNIRQIQNILKLVSAILYQMFIFSPNDKPFKNYEKCFLFHLKSSFRSRDIQIFVFFSLPFHTFRNGCFGIFTKTIKRFGTSFCCTFSA